MSLAHAASEDQLRTNDPLLVLERYSEEPNSADLGLLVERFLPLARHLARRYGAAADRDDVEQVAAIGLIKAIKRFDPSRGIAFTSFAVPTIIGEIKRYFRDFGWSVRVPRSLQELSARVERAAEELSLELGRTPTTDQIAHRCGVTIERVLEARMMATAHRADSLDRPARDDDETRGTLIGDEDREFEDTERATDIDRILATLPEREALILRLRFHENLLQHEIAARVGISQMQVSRLIARAVTALRDDASLEAYRSVSSSTS